MYVCIYVCMYVCINIEGSKTSKKSRRLRQKSGEIFQEIWKSEILQVKIYS